MESLGPISAVKVKGDVNDANTVSGFPDKSLGNFRVRCDWLPQVGLRLPGNIKASRAAQLDTLAEKWRGKIAGLFVSLIDG